MSSDKYDVVIVAFPGRDTAQNVYDLLIKLEQAGELQIHNAGILYRKDDGHLKLVQKRRFSVGKGVVGGGTAGLLLGLLLGGPVGLAAAGALAGGLMGATGSGRRRKVKELLDEKLGPHDSALALAIASADWPQVLDQTAHYSGETIHVKLTPESRAQLEDLATQDEFVQAVQKSLEEETPPQ